ncbi:MAG: hypothetical protein FD143_3380, partial [Ignavibacteria bacterium]
TKRDVQPGYHLYTKFNIVYFAGVLVV